MLLQILAFNLANIWLLSTLGAGGFGSCLCGYAKKSYLFLLLLSIKKWNADNADL